MVMRLTAALTAQTAGGTRHEKLIISRGRKQTLLYLQQWIQGDARALLVRIVENALCDRHDWFTARMRTNRAVSRLGEIVGSPRRFSLVLPDPFFPLDENPRVV